MGDLSVNHCALGYAASKNEECGQMEWSSGWPCRNSSGVVYNWIGFHSLSFNLYYSSADVVTSSVPCWISIFNPTYLLGRNPYRFYRTRSYHSELINPDLTISRFHVPLILLDAMGNVPLRFLVFMRRPSHDWSWATISLCLNLWLWTKTCLEIILLI